MEDRTNGTSNRILNGWKEIAQYLGRGVRTVQRWESLYKMPVRRPADRDRSAVIAFPDEVDNWLRQTRMEGAPYVRPTIVVMDHPTEETLSNRKLTLEIGKFNVLTAFTPQELMATAEKYDADGFVIDTTLVSESTPGICAELKKKYPRKPVIAIGLEQGESPEADRFVQVGKPDLLLETACELFGEPQVIPAA